MNIFARGLMFCMLLTNANITTQEMAQYDYYC